MLEFLWLTKDLRIRKFAALKLSMVKRMKYLSKSLGLAVALSCSILGNLNNAPYAQDVARRLPSKRVYIFVA